MRHGLREDFFGLCDGVGGVGGASNGYPGESDVAQRVVLLCRRKTNERKTSCCGVADTRRMRWSVSCVWLTSIVETRGM